MKYLAFAVLLFCVTSSSLAEDLYWYEFALAGPTAKEIKTIIGSSAEEPEAMAILLAQPEPIMLQNLRELFNGTYRAEPGKVRVYIPTKAILYLSVLKGDPAPKN